MQAISGNKFDTTSKKALFASSLNPYSPEKKISPRPVYPKQKESEIELQNTYFNLKPAMTASMADSKDNKQTYGTENIDGQITFNASADVFNKGIKKTSKPMSPNPLNEPDTARMDLPDTHRSIHAQAMPRESIVPNQIEMLTPEKVLDQAELSRRQHSRVNTDDIDLILNRK